MGYRAVIFDLGGVVLDSPLHAIARYERELGIVETVARASLREAQTMNLRTPLGAHGRRQVEEEHSVGHVFRIEHLLPRLVAVYEHWWNQYVSPGEAIYAHRGEGEEMVERMIERGRVPSGELHRKEIFL